MMMEVNVLVGCTGSVAAIKLPLLLETIQLTLSNKCRVALRVCMTEKAKHFCPPGSVSEVARVYSDADEWMSWQSRGDPVLHIDITKWADIFVIAPLDANSLGKIASFVLSKKWFRQTLEGFNPCNTSDTHFEGICDNMLTCSVRAWNVNKPLIFCPAMNTRMWEHPITSAQINTLKGWGYQEVPCISKTLMCGDTGLGAMAEPKDIAEVVSFQVDLLLKRRGL